MQESTDNTCETAPGYSHSLVTLFAVPADPFVNAGKSFELKAQRAGISDMGPEAVGPGNQNFSPPYVIWR